MVLATAVPMLVGLLASTRRTLRRWPKQTENAIEEVVGQVLIGEQVDVLRGEDRGAERDQLDAGRFAIAQPSGWRDGCG
jgi:hypothetical protein